jgi:hypothetical protein
MEWIILALASGVLAAAYIARKNTATAGPATNPGGGGLSPIVHSRPSPGSKVVIDGREWTIGPDGIPRDAAGNVITTDAGVAAANATTHAASAKRALPAGGMPPLTTDAGVAAANATTHAASAKRALTAAELTAAQAQRAAIAAQTAADEARRGEYANMEQRVREANEARAAAEAAQRAAEAARAASDRAAAERQVAVAAAAAVIREKAPILERKRAELTTLRNRIVVNRGLAVNVARLRRGLADRLERYPEILRFTYGGPDNLTLVPYAGPIEAVDYGTERHRGVTGARALAQLTGRAEPFPNVRLLTTTDMQTRTQWLLMGTQVNESLAMIARDEDAIAVLTGEVETLNREVTDAQASIGQGPSTNRVQAGGQEVTTETTIPGASGASRAPSAVSMRDRRAGIRNAH